MTDDMEKKIASVRVHMDDTLKCRLYELMEADQRESLSEYCRIVLKNHVAMMTAPPLREQPESPGRSVPLRAVTIAAAPFDDQERMA